MPITIRTRFTSAVVEANQDVFTRSYVEGENTVIEFDMRKRDYQKESGISSEIHWPEKHTMLTCVSFQLFIIRLSADSYQHRAGIMTIRVAGYGSPRKSVKYQRGSM